MRKSTYQNGLEERKTNVLQSQIPQNRLFNAFDQIKSYLTGDILKT